jgi:hypothetical protein
VVNDISHDSVHPTLPMQKKIFLAVLVAIMVPTTFWRSYQFIRSTDSQISIPPSHRSDISFLALIQECEGNLQPLTFKRLAEAANMLSRSLAASPDERAVELAHPDVQSSLKNLFSHTSPGGEDLMLKGSILRLLFASANSPQTSTADQQRLLDTCVWALLYLDSELPNLRTHIATNTDERNVGRSTPKTINASEAQFKARVNYRVGTSKQILRNSLGQASNCLYRMGITGYNDRVDYFTKSGFSQYALGILREEIAEDVPNAK